MSISDENERAKGAEATEKSEHGGDVYRNQVNLDFSVNINPFGIPDKVKEALFQAVSLCTQYPDDKVFDLTQKLAGKIGISPECLLFGNGASELFWAIVHAIKPKTVLIPVPSFSGYQKAAVCEDCEMRFYYMKEKDAFSLTEDFLVELTDSKKENRPDLIFLANPNNPTGSCIPAELLCRIVKLCREEKIWIVVDECFLAFTQRQEDTLLQEAVRSPYLIVVRAFTKIYGIPGVRLGYLVSEREMVLRLKKHLPEWNVSLLAQYAGAAALEEDDFVKQTSSYIKEQRAYLKTELEKLGITVFPGEADYLLINSDSKLYEKLLARKILIRDCSNYFGLREGYYRIAVKKRNENEQLLAAVKESITHDTGHGQQRA